MNTQKPLHNLMFEPMCFSDLKQVLAIENECFDDPWSLRYFELSLKRPKSYEYFYVARCEANVVGYIVFSVLSEEAQILNIAVSKAYQRQGIGRYLLASALEMIHAHGGREICLEVRVSNLPAQYLYRQFGFRICGIRKHYYGRHQDAYIFRKGAEADAT